MLYLFEVNANDYLMWCLPWLAIRSTHAWFKSLSCKTPVFLPVAYRHYSVGLFSSVITMLYRIITAFMGSVLHTGPFNAFSHVHNFRTIGQFRKNRTPIEMYQPWFEITLIRWFWYDSRYNRNSRSRILRWYLYIYGITRGMVRV